MSIGAATARCSRGQTKALGRLMNKNTKEEEKVVSMAAYCWCHIVAYIWLAATPHHDGWTKMKIMEPNLSRIHHKKDSSRCTQDDRLVLSVACLKTNTNLMPAYCMHLVLATPPPLYPTFSEGSVYGSAQLQRQCSSTMHCKHFKGFAPISPRRRSTTIFNY